MRSNKNGTNQQPVELERLERKENEIWRLAIFMLVVLSVGVGILAKQALETTPWRLDALPIGAGVLIFLFCIYLWTRKHKINELRNFARGFQKVQGQLVLLTFIGHFGDAQHGIGAGFPGYQALDKLHAPAGIASQQVNKSQMLDGSLVIFRMYGLRSLHVYNRLHDRHPEGVIGCYENRSRDTA